MLKHWKTWGVTGILLLGLWCGVAPAQELEALPNPSPAKAQTLPAKGSSKYATSKPLSVTVTKSLFLPPEMYGHWSVSGFLEETNAPDFFNPTVHDIWILDRTEDQVILSNPATGASASVQVDKVHGNTATFHRMVTVDQKKLFYEMPTITVAGDTLSGITFNKYQRVRNGQVVRSYFAKYRLEARRVGDSRTKFKSEEEQENLDFEVEDIQQR